MPTVAGSTLVVEVWTDPDGAGAGVAGWFPVNDMNRFSRRTTRGTSRTRVFMRTRPYVMRGSREFTATLSGFLNTDDPGQNALRAAMNTDVAVRMRILPDGVNGFEQDFYVGTQGGDASPDPTGLQEVSFELADANDPTVILAGPIL